MDLEDKIDDDKKVIQKLRDEIDEMKRQFQNQMSNDKDSLNKLI